MNFKRIYFRCDSSDIIGVGHVMRCLTIADKLNKFGFECCFITSLSSGNIIHKIKLKSFNIINLPKYFFEGDFDSLRESNSHKFKSFENNDFDNIWVKRKQIKSENILIVDHYLLGFDWQKKARLIFDKIIVIDDLLNSPHDCDLIIDPNIRDPRELRNYNLTFNKKSTPILSGSKYLIIRPEFQIERNQIEKKLNKKKSEINLLIMFGGGDNNQHISAALNQLNKIHIKINIHLVVNNADYNHQKIDSLVQNNKKVSIYKFSDQIHKVMSKCDVALGALGTTTWERCYLGIPALVFAVKKNQLGFLKYLVSQNIVFDLGGEITFEKIKKGFDYYKVGKSQFKLIKKKLFKIIDGNGLDRIVNSIVS